MLRTDRNALQKCVKAFGATAEGRARLRSWEASGMPWDERAHAACYELQTDALGLTPWQPPPCWAEDGGPPHEDNMVLGRVAAWELRRRMRKLGLSPFEPDPPRAIAEAEAGRQGKLMPLRAEPPTAA